MYAPECEHAMADLETKVIGVHPQQRLGKQINLQYSFLHPCNKAETWKQNIKGWLLWTGQINKHQWWRKKVSHSLEYPEGFSISGQWWPLSCSLHYTVSSPAFSRWTLLRPSWRRIWGECFRKWLPHVRDVQSWLEGRWIPVAVPRGKTESMVKIE